MKLVYLDCFSGAAGDMLLGALIDAGGDERLVRADLEGLGLSGWSLAIEDTMRGGVRAKRAVVTITDDVGERSHRDLRDLLEHSTLDAAVKRRASDTFRLLAEAEARVHGVDPQDVHLHEAGAIDAIVDIVGCASALESIGPDRVVSSPLPLGSGMVQSAHGVLPVPAPAVMELLRGVPVVGGGEGELVTPTGAAIIRAAADSFGDVPPMTLDSCGWGAGARERAVPNVVRAMVGEQTAPSSDGGALLIETNIDDMSPELFPYIIQQLMAAGVSDAWVTTVLMKKGRPGYVLSCLARNQERGRVLDVIYSETTTLGVRIQPVERDVLAREWIEVEVRSEKVRVKIGRRVGAVVTRAPEHDDAVKVARATGLPLKEIYRLAVAAAEAAAATDAPSR